MSQLPQRIQYRQYHGSIYSIPSDLPVPMLRPVTKTGGTDSRSSRSPPPTQCKIPDVSGVPFKITDRETNKPCMLSYPNCAPQGQWLCIKEHIPAYSTRSRPSSRSSSYSYGGHYDATYDGPSMDLPPLRTEPHRGSPHSEVDDSMSVDELDDEEYGLPESLKQFKLRRPQSRGSEYSSVSPPPSSQSPEILPIGLTPDYKVPPSPLPSPPPQAAIICPTAPERRKVVRHRTQTPAAVQHDPAFRAALDEVLRGSRLADITVPMLRLLIKKTPTPPHLNGKWEEYAEYIPDGKDSGKDHRCLYDPENCQYTAKKQLVQRHIEGVHLKIKPHKCPCCKSAFHQETSAITHISSIHLKVLPLHCELGVDCPLRFNDVARRHRHYKDAHGYVSKKTRRGNYKTSRSKKAPVVKRHAKL